MWSLKITTEQRYKYFEPILPDIKTDIWLYVKSVMTSDIYQQAIRSGKTNTLQASLDWIIQHMNSFIIERTLDNQYQITFYE